jgi:hypothetical protein
MSVRSGQSIEVRFYTQGSSGSVNADSLPTGALVVNGTVNGATVTVANVGTGKYTANVTLPTLAIGDQVAIEITATVSSITNVATIWADTKDLAFDTSGAVTFNNTTIATVTTLTNLPAIPNNWLVATGIASGALVSAVWDGSTTGHTGAGTFGGALNAAGGTGDPWATSLPGSYTSGQAGFIVGSTVGPGVSAIVGKLPTNTIADETLVIAATSSILSVLGTPAATVSTDIAGVRTVVNTINSAVAALPSASAIATAVWGFVAEGAFTAVQLLRGIAATLLGASTGAGTSGEAYKAAGGSTVRVQPNSDSSGNRTNPTLNL